MKDIMKKNILSKIVFTTIILNIYSQVMAMDPLSKDRYLKDFSKNSDTSDIVLESNNSLTPEEICSFLDSINTSLEKVAKSSGYELDNSYTYLDFAKSFYLLGIGVGMAGGFAAVGGNTYNTVSSGANFNLTTATATGSIILGHVIGNVISALFPLASAPVTIKKAAAITAVTGTLISDATAGVGAAAAAYTTKTTDVTKRNIPTSGISDATYVNNHYRVKLHYRVIHPLKSQAIENSCLLFFSIDPFGGLDDYAINFEIDACNDSDIFPQEQEGWIRLGDFIDPSDVLMGQDKVVTSGQFKLLGRDH